MFVGHEFLAFAVVGTLASARGYNSETAVSLGLVGALAALLPDLDLAYGLVTYLAIAFDGASLSWEGFWRRSSGVHRVATHSLPVGVAASACVAAGTVVGRRRAAPSPDPFPVAAAGAGVGIVGGGALSVVSASTLGPAGTSVLVAFLGVAALVGGWLGYATRLPVSGIVAAATVGLVTHPFGDLFMADPPPLLAPVGPAVVTERVTLAADETLNLLGILFVEGGIVLSGLLAYARLTGRNLRDAVALRAALGVAYAPTAVFLPRPTMADAHVLGFTVVPLAVLVGLSASPRRGRSTADGAIRGATTGLVTLLVAAGAYAAVYVAAG